MARTRELPQLVSEFFDLAKAYLRQETIEPVKRLGRALAMGLAAGVAFFLGAIFLAVAGVRLAVEVMPAEPANPWWSALGYVAAAMGLLVLTAVVAKVASK